MSDGWTIDHNEGPGGSGLYRRGRMSLRPLISALAAVGMLTVAGCQSTSYSLQCDQGVDRQVCVRVAAFGFAAAEVAADTVHVQQRSCSKYLDPSPADARCFTVRMVSDEGRVVVAVAQTGEELIGPLDLLPTDE